MYWGSGDRRSTVSRENGGETLSHVLLAQIAFGIMSDIWRLKIISRETKVILFNYNVKSILLYGSETLIEN